MKDETRLKPKVCPDGVEDCDDKGSLGVMMTDHKKVAAAQNHIANVKRQINNMEELYNTGGTYGDESDLNALYEELQEFEDLVKSNPKKWTSVSEIQNQIQMVDQSSIEVIAQLRSSAYNKGKDVLPEDNIGFNKSSARQVVEETVMGSANMMSLIYDPMFGKTSFYDDLVSSITGDTYGDYGITDDQVYTLGDLNADGKISNSEAELIAQEFVGTDFENNDQLYNTMSDYLVQHLENNYELGKSENRDSYIPQVDKKISDRDENGVYIPQSQRGDNTQEKEYHTGPSGKKYTVKDQNVNLEENFENEDEEEEEDDK
jgi:hypothetical protein